jgi:preprotein translocase subunit SecE
MGGFDLSNFHMSKKIGGALVAYFQDSFQELKRVTWPTKQQAIKLTLLVLGFCLLAAIFIGLFDLLFNYGYYQLIQLSK